MNAETLMCEGSQLKEGVRFAGSFVAMVSPCVEPGVVDRAATVQLASRLVEEGCQGMLAAGSTGMLPLMDERARREVIGGAVEGVNGRGTVFAGVSGTGWRDALRYAKCAQQDGADVVTVMVPFGFAFGQKELVAYFRRIAEASPLPVALYHHPAMSSPIAVETVAALAGHENIVAMKDTGVDLERHRQVVAIGRENGVAVLQGSEGGLFESLEAGSAGWVTALANFAPGWHARLMRDWREGRKEEARQWQARIAALQGMFREPGVGSTLSGFEHSIKWMLQKRGWLSSTDGMMEGFVPGDSVLAFLERHWAGVQEEGPLV